MSSSEGSAMENTKLVVTDKRCEQPSAASSSGGATSSPDSEESVSETSARATLEGEYLSEFIDLLARKGARVANRTQDGS